MCAAAATHDQGGTLDLILTHVSFKEKLQPPVIIPSSTRSDYFLVLFDAELKPKVCEDLRLSGSLATGDSRTLILMNYSRLTL